MKLDFHGVTRGIDVTSTPLQRGAPRQRLCLCPMRGRCRGALAHLTGDDMRNDFLMAICDSNSERLEAVHALLVELDDSELVTRLSSELSVNVPDLIDAVQALLGAVREERDSAENSHTLASV